MNDPHIYTIANHVPKLRIMRTELAPNCIITSVSQDGIHERDIETFLYTDISKVTISLIDGNQYQIAFSFNSGKTLKVISVSLGWLEDGKLQRGTVDQTVAFNEWVCAFHKMMIEKKLAPNIKFFTSSTGRPLKLVLLLMAGTIGLFFACLKGSRSVVYALLFLATIIIVLIYKKSINKTYNPESKLLKQTKQ